MQPMSNCDLAVATETVGGFQDSDNHASFIPFPSCSSTVHQPNPYCKFPTKLVLSSTI